MVAEFIYEDRNDANNAVLNLAVEHRFPFDLAPARRDVILAQADQESVAGLDALLHPLGQAVPRTDLISVPPDQRALLLQPRNQWRNQLSIEVGVAHERATLIHLGV